MTVHCLKKRALRMAVAAFSEQRWYPDIPRNQAARRPQGMGNLRDPAVGNIMSLDTRYAKSFVLINLCRKPTICARSVSNIGLKKTSCAAANLCIISNAFSRPFAVSATS